MVVECKYPYKTLDPGYVGRGVSQAYFYGRQLSPAFSHTEAFVAGPADFVRCGETKHLDGIALHIVSPDLIAERVSAVLQN
jgi:hypothetical protein